MKKISFNYYLTNITMPRMISANKEFFFERILPISSNLQTFLKDCVGFVNENSGDNVEKIMKSLPFLKG